MKELDVTKPYPSDEEIERMPTMEMEGIAVAQIDSLLEQWRRNISGAPMDEATEQRWAGIEACIDDLSAALQQARDDARKASAGLPHGTPRELPKAFNASIERAVKQQK